MHRVDANYKKNRLYFHLSGNIDKRESKSVLDSMIRSLEYLKPGFDIISDITDYTPLSRSADITISSLFKTIKEHGVRKTIKISNSNDFSSSLAANLLIDEVGFRDCEIVDSLEEAEKLLEN